MQIKKYTLVTDSKIERAKAAAKAAGREDDEDAILFEYDKLAGLIRDEDGNKVPEGTFYKMNGLDTKKETDKGEGKKVAKKAGKKVANLDDNETDAI